MGEWSPDGRTGLSHLIEHRLAVLAPEAAYCARHETSAKVESQKADWARESEHGGSHKGKGNHVEQKVGRAIVADTAGQQGPPPSLSEIGLARKKVADHEEVWAWIIEAPQRLVAVLPTKEDGRVETKEQIDEPFVALVEHCPGSTRVDASHGDQASCAAA